MANPTGKGGFKKGDPRINRKGRPKSFDGLRALALEIAHEKTKTKEGEILTINGRAVSVAERILRQWAMSRNSKQQQWFMEVAFGKVPAAVEVSGKDGAPLTFEVVYVNPPPPIADES